MKKLFVLIVIVGVIVVGVYFLVKRFSKNDESQIKEVFKSLSGSLSYSGGLSNFEKLKRSENIVNRFVPEVYIEIEGIGPVPISFRGREEIRNTLMFAFNQVRELRVNFDDTKVQLGPDKLNATVITTASASANNGEDYGVQEVECRLIKTNKAWLIERVATRDILRR